VAESITPLNVAIVSFTTVGGGISGGDVTVSISDRCRAVSQNVLNIVSSVMKIFLNVSVNICVDQAIPLALEAEGLLLKKGK